MNNARKLFPVTIACHCLAALLSLALLTLLAACSDTTKREPVSTDPIWSEYVSAHSNGTISKGAKISIHFVNDIIDNAKVGKSAAKQVSITPSIKANIRFINPREISIEPNTTLTSGKRYTISIKTGELLGFPDQLDRYTFEVNTLPQNFEISTDGLKTDPHNDQQMILTGSLISADISDNNKVEEVLQAQYSGKSMDINWQHSSDSLQHQFSLSGIQRSKGGASIMLHWDGEPLGVDDRGSREIKVPAPGIFNVTYAKVVYGQKQYIEVRFSDDIQKPQSVADFISLGSHTFSARIEANTIKIYPRNSLKGDIPLTIRDGIRNTRGDRLQTEFSKQLVFTSQKPQVRFVGKGVIIPENKFLSIPFETINVHSVQVTAFRIYENNVGQFLQSNKLAGDTDLQRVGRYLWRKTIQLSAPESDHWNRYALDATQLLKQHPGGMYRLTLSINRGNSTYTCTEEENAVPVIKEAPFNNHNDLNVTDSSGWDFVDEYYNSDSQRNEWRDRNNPCKDAYYRHASDTTQSRNFIGSNIGLIAKRDNTGQINIVATDLRDTKPLNNVAISVYNFQNQVIASLKTDQQGFASVTDKGMPFYVSAKKGQQIGYLKMSPGTALPVSHFDVGGYKLQNGIKGHIYGERGVWRPGDAIYLTLVVEDKQKILPKQHPVSMSLINPQGQVIHTLHNNQPVDNFYHFKFQTAENAPTGNWTARARLGGRIYNKRLKIETVVPNRLKLELDFGADTLYASADKLNGTLFSQWLHGAKASGLKADIAVRFSPINTSFGRFTDFIFDDPTREFASDSNIIIEGELDQEGYLKFSQPLQATAGAPGMLAAYFTSRVFEQSGAFSSSVSRFTFHPYQNYVGIKLPKGDQTRGMLLTDTDHVVEIASLDAKGDKTSLNNVEVSLYKIHWKWWWDQTADSLARYANANLHDRLQHDTIKTKDGRGQWILKVKYPDWGRYLVRACDLDGKHCSGKVLYIDWPGWAGRAQEQSGPGASVLNISSAKPEYKVGETALLNLPAASQGRALLTLENGSRILQQKWLQVAKDKTQFPVKITADMTPNVYASVTLIQPHQGKDNDRPIRLYGVTPIKVIDPKTHIKPELKVADEWAPDSSVTIGVKEQQGRAMTYTLAVVDEGLLGLTSFKTPDLHKQFYKKEALGVKTWDLFDEVLNAYGGKLERILALGGGADGEQDENKEKRRFPPVVKFLGPFHLPRGEQKTHNIKIPAYIGAVRVMLVAAHDGAYGSASKSVFVRQPVMLLPTLPRLVGTEETFSVPVSVFVTDPEVKQVELNIKTDDYFDVVGDKQTKLTFTSPGDKLGFLTLRSRARIGQGRVDLTLVSGKHRSKATVYLNVRTPNPPTTRLVHEVLKPGSSWSYDIVPHGLENSNEVNLEISSLPPFNLAGRLKYLVRYPYGCLEQITSSVFPQLYLPKILQMGEQKNDEIANNIHAAIDKLRHFQYSDGGFRYWPGNRRYSAWANNYAGHFLIEAQKLGYHVPDDMLSAWLQYQGQQARRWVTGSSADVQNQAYSLYTLAAANKAELGAMNRLRENNHLDNLGRWYLGAAYKLAGQPHAAEALINPLPLEFTGTDHASHDSGWQSNFGSAIRDKAIALNALVLLGRDEQAMQLTQELSKSLLSDQWFSTQSIAYSLSALANYIGVNAGSEPLQVIARVGNNKDNTWKWNNPIFQQALNISQKDPTRLQLDNKNQRMLFVTLNVTGNPAAGNETDSANGLRLETAYQDSDGNVLDIRRLQQGRDFRVQVSVTNTSGHELENLALSHILAAGWEIHNDRLDSGEGSNVNSKIDYRDIRDDRVYTFFKLNTNETKRFTIVLNAAYSGHYYLPGLNVEDMYDASTHARIKGQWVDVVK